MKKTHTHRWHIQEDKTEERQCWVTQGKFSCPAKASREQENFSHSHYPPARKKIYSQFTGISQFDSSSHPGQAPICNEKNKSLSDVHQHPPCPRAQRQTTNRVEIIKKKQLSIQQLHEANAAILANRARGPEKFSLLGI
ncbi:hypothetical protein J3E68DRAFT_403210, partial [Trichoderma sp. SZMC 28012]